MRTIWIAGVALTAALIGPAAVADATADNAVRDLIERPQVCGQAGSANPARRSSTWSWSTVSARAASS